MAECYCHTSSTMRLAEIEMQDYIELHRTREITKRFLEIYALILIGLGEEMESNSESEEK